MFRLVASSCCCASSGRMSLVSLVALLLVVGTATVPFGASGQLSRQRNQIRSKIDSSILKDAFHEDYKSIVKIKTTYNATTSITCNGVVMESPNLVLSDVSCIKYQNMANIDARFVKVLVGEQQLNSETEYEVDQIFLNKANPNDPSTELALLKLRRPIATESPCLSVKVPELNASIVPESAVRVVGYTQNFPELKENRTKIHRRSPTGSEKYVCTTPADMNETPGAHLLKGAPLLAAVECRTYIMIGILTKVDTFFDGATRKQQDCYVMVMSQMRWYNQVKMLATVTAKNSDGIVSQPSVVVVSVDD